MERNAQSGVHSIRAAGYGPFAGELRHIFLTGDLSRPCPHPFFQDARLEMLIRVYEPGDHCVRECHHRVREFGEVS